MSNRLAKAGGRSLSTLHSMLYVQYGCGDCAPEGWENFDASPRLRIERLPLVGRLARFATAHPFPANVRWGEICRGLPIPDGLAAGVYCSHVLEHLPRGALTAALSQTWRMLRPGGVFRMVVPDLEWRAKAYVKAAARREPLAADRFLASCLLGTQDRHRGVLALVRRTHGNSAHLWMYDFAAIEWLLQGFGFAKVRRCAPGDAEDPMFALAEDINRFFEGGDRELAIEAVKPT